MNQVHFAHPLDTPEAIARAMAAYPEYSEYYRRISRAGRSKLRARLRTDGFNDAQIEVLAPMDKPGRPARGPRVDPFAGLSRPAKTVVAEALGLDEFPEALDDWGADDTAAVAADALVEYYTNPTSAAVALTALRNGLKALGAPQEVIASTFRAGVTEAHNARMEVRRAERAAEGLNIPGPYQRIADLRARVATYLAAGPRWIPDGQAAADLLVALSARPGEADTLDLGARGGVVGVLKKRGTDQTYNLVSALGLETAQALLAAWKRSSATHRRAAMADLGHLVTGWAIQRRDLRAIGSHLAARAAVLAGDARNAVEVRDVQQAALRHAPAAPGRRAAVDHYARVNDDVAQLCAQLAELGAEDRERVRQLIDRRLR